MTIVQLLMLIVSVLVLDKIMPASNNGKTDYWSRFLGLFGMTVDVSLEDMEKQAGFIQPDGYDATLAKFKIARLAKSMGVCNDTDSDTDTG